MSSVFRGRVLASGIFALLVVAAPPVRAQTIGTGAVQGVVVDSAGLPLYDALVTATDLATGISRSATTARDGRFRLGLLPPGVYTLLVERLGHRPRRYEGIRIRSADALELAVTLPASAPPVNGAEVVRLDAASAIGPDRLPARDLDLLPLGDRDLASIVRLSSAATADFETEGLPSSLSGFLVDGLPVELARHPALPAEAPLTAAFPLSALADARLVTATPGLEWAGAAGGLLSTLTRRGSGELSVETFGSWSGAGLWSSGLYDAGAVDPADVRGGLVVGGPLVRDSAHFIIGVEAQRTRSPVPAAWAADSASDAVIAVARDSFDTAVDRYRATGEAEGGWLAAFGRLDWMLSGNHALGLRASVGTLSPGGAYRGVATGPLHGARIEGEDIAAAATLSSQFGDRLSHELRIGFDRSRREYTADEPGAAIPHTIFADPGIELGAGTVPASVRQQSVRLRQSAHYVFEDHELAAGVALDYGWYTSTYAHDYAGTFMFGGADAFGRVLGAYVRTTGLPPVAEFVVPRFGIFVQDRWRAMPGLTLTAGLRYDAERLPGDRIGSDAEWRDLTGLDNADLGGVRSRLGPRFGLRWELGPAWVLEATTGVYNDRIDPAIVAELMTHDGGIRVLRGVGALGAWPEQPGPSAAPEVGRRLALLGPDFNAPRTARLSLGLRGAVAPWLSVGAGFTLRRTDYLPRRVDLNTIPAPVGEDAHGRPLYGELVQYGALIAATPGSNRRFPAFDRVYAINADGRSDYWDVSFAVDLRRGDWLRAFGRYTYARTTDDAFGARAAGPEAALPPFPQGLDGVDWAEGRSDFDLPHRLLAGAVLDVPGRLGPRLAAVYRYRSGYPYTPGFRNGVDANGDGSASNDPAYIDADVPGMEALIAERPCLRSQVGGFAERNACRAPAHHALDLRLGLDLFSAAGGAVSLVVEGLNVIDSETGIVDHAVYLVDPDGALTRDDATGVTTIPLKANPNFGRYRLRSSPGRLVRIGLQVNF